MAIANITNNILTDSGIATSSLLPLSGGTLTGALSGTSAGFSGALALGGALNITVPYSAGTMTILTQDNLGNGIYLAPRSNLNFDYGVANNTTGIINNFGYQNGSAHFRSLGIGDGKGGTIAFFDGVNSRVGIGTASPNFKLHISTGTTTSITQPTAGTYGLYIQQNTSGNVGGLYIQDGASNTGNSIFVGDNNGAARFVVNTDGNVIIGTSSDAGITLVPASGTSKYQTAGDGGSGSIWHASIETTWANYENYGCSQMTFKTELKASGTSDTSVTQMVIRPTGDIRMTSLVGTGSRTVTADANGTLSASSDSSLKQEDTSHKIEGLAEILQLKPRAYKWLSDIEIRGENAATEIGFFANEVNPIIPSAAPKGNYDLYGFYDRAVIAALVKAIQEQNQTITSLQDRLDKAGL